MEFRMASRMRLAASGLSSAINSHISVMSGVRFGMQPETLACGHFGVCFFSSSSSRSRKLSKKASPSTGLTRPLLMSS